MKASSHETAGQLRGRSVSRQRLKSTKAKALYREDLVYRRILGADSKRAGLAARSGGSYGTKAGHERFLEDHEPVMLYATTFEEALLAALNVASRQAEVTDGDRS